MNSYVFQVELAHEDDGRWSTWIDVLPGCAAWGYTKEEALQASKTCERYAPYWHSQQCNRRIDTMLVR